MADKLEAQLAEGIENDHTVKAMAEKLAPRTPGTYSAPQAMSAVPYGGRTAPVHSVEARLQAIEKLIAEIRQANAEIRERLG